MEENELITNQIKYIAAQNDELEKVFKIVMIECQICTNP